MRVSKDAQLFISRCFDINGQPLAIMPMFNEKYIIKDTTCKFTKVLLDEMLATGKVRVTSESQKFVNIVGIVQIGEGD